MRQGVLSPQPRGSLIAATRPKSIAPVQLPSAHRLSQAFSSRQLQASVRRRLQVRSKMMGSCGIQLGSGFYTTQSAFSMGYGGGLTAGSHQIPARSRPQELLRRAKEPKTGVEEEDRAGQARGSKRAGTLLCCCCCWFWLVSAWQEGERESRERRRLKRGGSCEEVVTISWPKACR